MKYNFCFAQRPEYLDHIAGKDYDVIVIGGGVTGAGIALDAVTRGFRTLLVEQNDFASGTSSKSTKLIHGGLRYLKQFEFGLVRETGTERAIVHALAPHLVHPERMFLPIVREGSFSKWSASLAISVYDWLAGVRHKDRKRVLDKEKACDTEPLLPRSKLKAGLLYSEYRTDDARLTFEIIRKAFELGGDVLNYCQLQQLHYAQGKVVGVELKEASTGRQFRVNASAVVSAAGPWVDRIRTLDNSRKGKHLRLTKGVHLVFNRKHLPVRQAIYFDDFKGRMLFAIPRQTVTYVGTSDTDHKGPLSGLTCSDSDYDYILNAVNSYFDLPSPLTRAEVVSSWAGLRPLIAEEGKDASEVSRKDEIFVSDSGLVSIAGGKLTGYRKMASRVIDVLQERDDSLPSGKCKTEHIHLTDKPFTDYNAVKEYVSLISGKLEGSNVPEHRSEYLVFNYGHKAGTIVDQAFQSASRYPDLDVAILMAELDHCINEESCWKPADFFNRRTGMLYFEPQRLIDNFDRILDAFCRAFDWGAEMNTEQYRTAVDDVKISIPGFDPKISGPE